MFSATVARDRDLPQFRSRAFDFVEAPQVLGQIVRHISDQLNVMGLFYDLRITLVSNRITNLSGGSPAWNGHLWELAS